MAEIDRLLKAVVDNQLETLHVVAGHRPQVIGGANRFQAGPDPIADDTIQEWLLKMMPEGETPDRGAGASHSFHYDSNGSSFRCSASRTSSGWTLRATLDGEETTSTEALAGSKEPAVAPADPAPATPAPPAPTPAGPTEAPSPPAAPAAAGKPGASAGGTELPPIPQLLTEMIQRDASDLHLSAGQRPRMRVHGELTPLGHYAVPSSDTLQQRLWEITPERNREEFEERHDSDFAYEIPGQARFRVNLFRDRLGVGAVFRQIPEEIPTFEQLNLPDVLRELAHLSKGLVLVTGPTGSGKSTTLAAIIDLINRSRHDHIITVEDPVEFVHPSKRCLVNQREVGIHTRTFKSALRAALREDPDILLVGEMRDLETISIAIETAETGHLVFGTLHTTTAASTVERVVDQFPGDRQDQIRVMLAESLRAVVAQTLLKRIEGGRVAAFEILICTPAVSNLIREGKTFQIPSAMQTGKGKGMQNLTDSLFDLVKERVVAPEEAYLKAVDKETLAAKLKGAGIRLDLSGDEAPSEG